MSSPPPFDPSLCHVNLSMSFGFSYWGMVFSTLFHGIAICQAYFYYTTYKDGWGIKSLVAFLLVVDTANVFLGAQAFNYYLVQNYGNAPSLLTANPALLIENATLVIVVACVQLYFAAQIYRFRQDMWMWSAVVVFFAVSSFSFGIYVSIEFFIQKTMAAFLLPIVRIPAALTNLTALIADFTYTFAMIYGLKPSEHGFQKTNTLIHRVLLFVVNRGVLVCLYQVVISVVFLAATDKLYWSTFHLTLGKVYVITLLAMLNSRDKLREGLNQGMAVNMNAQSALEFRLGDVTGTSSFPGSRMRSTFDNSSDPSVSQPERGGLQVYVERTVDKHEDLESMDGTKSSLKQF